MALALTGCPRLTCASASTAPCPAAGTCSALHWPGRPTGPTCCSTQKQAETATRSRYLTPFQTARLLSSSPPPCQHICRLSRCSIVYNLCCHALCRHVQLFGHMHRVQVNRPIMMLHRPEARANVPGSVQLLGHPRHLHARCVVVQSDGTLQQQAAPWQSGRPNSIHCQSMAKFITVCS
jgi:hypothetical protein